MAPKAKGASAKRTSAYETLSGKEHLKGAGDVIKKCVDHRMDGGIGGVREKLRVVLKKAPSPSSLSAARVPSS